MYFILTTSLVCGQVSGTHNQDTIYFKYDHNGLFPTELVFPKDTLSAEKIYNNVKYMLELATQALVDFEGKIVHDIPNESFTLKGEFTAAFCHIAMVEICTDGLVEIDFIFQEGSYIMKPIKIKRAVDLVKIPIQGRAFFYKKDNTIKKRFNQYPEAIESMLNWLALFSSLEPDSN
ncbi:MAG: hypothetical protein RQ756_09490 [Flavobacteriaceae bacterium]|nr:hypothetical protein [Flavobacteriaceae bacterium]